MTPIAAHKVSIAFPADGRVAGVWLEVCTTPCDRPCSDLANDWSFTRQTASIGVDRDVVLSIDGGVGPVHQMRSVNLDPGVAARWGETLTDLCVDRPGEAVFLPEPASGLAWAACLLAITFLRWWRRRS